MELVAQHRHGSNITGETRGQCQRRLARIEGQVRGLQRMFEEDRYCIDVVNQIDAVRGALRQVRQVVLKKHLTHCVNKALANGDPLILDELMIVVERIGRSD